MQNPQMQGIVKKAKRYHDEIPRIKIPSALEEARDYSGSRKTTI